MKRINQTLGQVKETITRAFKNEGFTVTKEPGELPCINPDRLEARYNNEIKIYGRIAVTELFVTLIVECKDLTEFPSAHSDYLRQLCSSFGNDSDGSWVGDWTTFLNFEEESIWYRNEKSWPNDVTEEIVQQFLKLCLAKWAEIYPIIQEGLKTEKDPEELLKEHRLEIRKCGMTTMKEKKKRGRKKQIDPFVHYPPDCSSAFPIHTHCLSEKNFPEFILDSATFGSLNGSRRLIAIVNYLYHSERRHLLDTVLSGKVLEISDSDLWPNSKMESPHVYNLREVTLDFEGAKKAYLYDNQTPFHPESRIIQIWLPENEYAIQDSYYKLKVCNYCHIQQHR